MSKKNKLIAIFVSSVLLCTGAIMAWLFWFPANVYTAIPDSAIAVIEVDSWKQLSDKLQTTYTGMAFKKTEMATRLFNELEGVSTVLSSDNSLSHALFSNHTVASVHLTSAEEYDFLFTGLFRGVDDNVLLHQIQSSPKVRQVNVRIFKGEKLIDVTLNDGRSWTFAKVRGVFMFSYTTFLTESAVSVMQTGENLKSDKSFKAVQSELPGLQFYMNLSRTDVLLPVFFQHTSLSLFSDLPKTGKWARYAVRFTNDAIRIDGAIDATRHQSEETLSQKSLTQALSILPANTAIAEIGSNDTTHLPGDNLANLFFKGWAGAFHAFVTIEPLSANFNDRNLFFLDVRNRSEAKKSVLDMLATEGSTGAPVDSFQNEPIYLFKSGHLINRVFRNNFCLLGTVYVIVYRNIAIFSSDKDVLKLTLDNINQNKVMAAKEKMGSDSLGSSNLFITLTRCTNLLSGMFRAQSTIPEFLQNFSAVTSYTKQQGGLVSQTIVFRAGQEKALSNDVVWKLETGTYLIGKPMPVKESKPTTAEIIVQDSLNHLFLITRDGKIKFKFKLDGKCLSDVYAVDYYHNGGRQYLFNTASHIYLLNEQGIDVASYPLRLSRRATAGLSLMNISENEVCYFVPCENGAVYGYELNGRPLAGWSPNGIAGQIYAPVIPFTVQGKNYVAITTSAGRLLVCDGRGHKQWSTPDGDSIGNPLMVSLASEAYFLLVNRNQLVRVNWKGHIDTTKLLEQASAFLAYPVSDTSFNYLYASGGALRAYNQQNQFIHSVALPAPKVSSIVKVDDKNWLLASDSTGQNAFVLDYSLTPIRNFSAQSNGEPGIVMDLFNDGRPVWLVITPAGQLSCIR